MISNLIPAPLDNISSDYPDHWIVTGVPAHLELKLENCSIPSGWVLIEGRLLRRGEKLSAYLIVGTKTNKTGCKTFSIPVSMKGLFSELVYLPEDVSRLKLEPMQSKGEFELFDLSLKPVGWWEKNFRILYRIIAFCEKYSFKFCYKAGLRWYMPLVNIAEVYYLLGRFNYFSPALDYADWLKKFDELSVKQSVLINKHIESWASQPRFKIFVNLNDVSNELIQQTFDSLDKQIFLNFSVTLLLPESSLIDNALSNLPDYVETSKQSVYSLISKDRKALSWVMMVEPGVVFPRHAMYWFASIILEESDSRFIYSDHDYLSQDGLRVNPVFKPDWSPELLRSINYIGPSGTAIRSDIFLNVIDNQGVSPQVFNYYDYFLRVCEQVKNNAVKHIPAVLGHLPLVLNESFAPSDSNLVVEHLKRLDISATVEPNGNNCNRVRYHIPEDLPLISLIIPTRNALSLLQPCVESILNLGSYKNFELIIVDNQSDDPSTLDFLDDLKQHPKVRVLQYDHPFNYSAINNFAVKESLGEVICLLNNDTEVITPGWLEEMLGHLMQQNVGVVGAKLYYSDGRVQHAGDTVGPGGCASHLHSMIGHDSPGYCNRAKVAQELSAVTGACLMTWRKLFLQVDGLDQVNLAIAFNDVDYCLKVRAAGYRVLWTPYAELYHYESVSRGQDNTTEKVKRSRKEANYIRKRWKHVMHHDPFYNPNLSYQRPDFSLSHAPMVGKPWERFF